MKAKLMYKTINGLAPQRLCEIFKNVKEIHNCNMGGSLAKLYIPKPKTEFLKIVLVIVRLSYETQYLKRYTTRVRVTRFVISFLPRPRSSLYRNISLYLTFSIYM